MERATGPAAAPADVTQGTVHSNSTPVGQSSSSCGSDETFTSVAQNGRNRPKQFRQCPNDLVHLSRF